MKNRVIVILAAGIAASSPAFGEATPAAEAKAPYAVSANVALVSDYVFRGLTQTNGTRAIRTLATGVLPAAITAISATPITSSA